MTLEEKTQIEERIVDVLKTIYDPEIPVNIYDLGMIYKIDVQDDHSVEMDVIDPICVGDAFMGGWLHAISLYPDDKQMQLNYSLAAAALKNTIPGDFNLSTKEDILDVLEGRHNPTTLYKRLSNSIVSPTQSSQILEMQKTRLIFGCSMEYHYLCSNYFEA